MNGERALVLMTVLHSVGILLSVRRWEVASLLLLMMLEMLLRVSWRRRHGRRALTMRRARSGLMGKDLALPAMVVCVPAGQAVVRTVVSPVGVLQLDGGSLDRAAIDRHRSRANGQHEGGRLRSVNVRGIAVMMMVVEVVIVRVASMTVGSRRCARLTAEARKAPVGCA